MDVFHHDRSQRYLLVDVLGLATGSMVYDANLDFAVPSIGADFAVSSIGADFAVSSADFAVSASESSIGADSSVSASESFIKDDLDADRAVSQPHWEDLSHRLHRGGRELPLDQDLRAFTPCTPSFDPSRV